MLLRLPSPRRARTLVMVVLALEISAVVGMIVIDLRLVAAAILACATLTFICTLSAYSAFDAALRDGSRR